MKEKERKTRKFIHGEGDDRVEISVEVTGDLDFKIYSANEADILEKIRNWLRSVAIEKEIEKIDAKK